MSLQLVAISGPDKGRSLLLHAGPDLMLGRSAQAYYQLSDPRVSRNHCQVLRDGDQVAIGRAQYRFSVRKGGEKR